MDCWVGFIGGSLRDNHIEEEGGPMKNGNYLGLTLDIDSGGWDFYWEKEFADFL